MDCTLYLEICANKTKRGTKRLSTISLTKYVTLLSFPSWIHCSKKVTLAAVCIQGCVSCLMHILLGAGVPWGWRSVAVVTSCGERWPGEGEGARGAPAPGRHRFASVLGAASGKAQGAAGMPQCARRDERLSPGCFLFGRVTWRHCWAFLLLLQSSGREGWREAAPSKEPRVTLAGKGCSFSGVAASPADSRNGEKLLKERGFGSYPAWDRAVGKRGKVWVRKVQRRRELHQTKQKRCTQTVTAQSQPLHGKGKEQTCRTN